jgi:hypothetical protein
MHEAAVGDNQETGTEANAASESADKADVEMK